MPKFPPLTAADIPDLDTSKITSGQFSLSRMPRAASGRFLMGDGVGSDPIFDVLVAGDIPSLDVAKITSGRFGMARMPAGTSGLVLTAQGAGADPVYAAAGAEVGGLYGINIETLSAAKTLTPDTDEIYQYLNPNGATRTITLATAGASAGDRFVVRNTGTYTGASRLEMKQDAVFLDRIYAGDVKEFIFDGTNWVSRGIGTGEDTNLKHNLAIGYRAMGYELGVGLGYDARGYTYGVAVGNSAWGYSYGAAVGQDALGYDFGATLGYKSEGDTYGAAIGYRAYGHTYGAAVGYRAAGQSYGVAIGYYADSGLKQYSNAIGHMAKCYRTAETSVNIDGLSARKNHVTQGRWAETTTDAAATEIFLAAIANERFTLRPKSALAFTGIVVASTEASVGTPNVTSSWKVEGLIKRDADGNTTMVGVTHAVIAQDGGAAAWNAVFSADDGNEALIITVTGAAATTIQWAACIDGVETSW